MIGLPNFRPFSFLTNLAERVLPSDTEPAAAPSSNGNGTERPATAGAACPEAEIAQVDDGPIRRLGSRRATT